MSSLPHDFEDRSLQPPSAREPARQADTPSEASPEPASAPAAADRADPPEADEFGLLDVIEAFTAMRHEWKTQTRESRQLAETIAQAVERVDMASRANPPAVVNAPAVVNSVDGDSESRRLAETIAEIEFTVTRALEVASRYSAETADRDDPSKSPVALLDDRFRQLSPWQRWLAGPWHRQVLQWLESRTRKPERADALQEGLALMHRRVAKLMQDCDIRREDVVGESFDAERMNAVDAVEATGLPRGQVVEQLRPAYTWKGQRLKFADVRVAV
jgi:hypothetical protein